MNLESAIARIFGGASKKSNAHKLDDAITQIFQKVMGEEKNDSSTNNDADGIFERLTQIAGSQEKEIFRELVEVDKQTRKKNDPTLLMSAVMAGKTEVVRELVAAGADVNVKVEQFFTFDAMHFAVKNENIQIVKILIDAGADVNSDAPLSSPIVEAIGKGNTELIKILLDAGARTVFETGFNTLAYVAGKVNNPEIIRLLLQSGCNINSTDNMGETALVNACLHGNDAVVNVLLDAGADVNQPRKDGLTPLLAALSIPQMREALSGLEVGEGNANVRQSMISIIEVLADKGSNLNIRTSLGGTALMSAAESGYLDIVQVLISKGADVNAVEDLSQPHHIHPLLQGMEESLAERCQHKTALIIATEKGHTNIVDALLKAGADFTIADKNNRTALNIAIQEGYTKIIQLLENTGAEAPKESTQFSEAALLGAAKQGNLETLNSALAFGISPNTSELGKGRNPRYKTALMFAVERGHLEVAKVLIKAGADVNLSDHPGKKLGKTPLMYAAISGHESILRFLLESGAVVDSQDKRGQTALWYAVSEEKANSVRILLEFGADPHKKSWDDTPFENATYAGQEIVDLIINSDKNRNSAASKAARAEMLGSAAFGDNVQLVRDFLQQGIDVNGTEKPGEWSALMYAAAKGHIDIVQILLAAGADVNYAANSGQTALSESVYWGHLEIVNLLISAGADINTCEMEDNTTPLMKALSFGNRTEIIKVLLKAGADPNIRNDADMTALGIAKESENTEIVEILRQAGGVE
ncbi:MAG: ankyrin repeat domain-containing protein [Cyanobacteria bacterium P01_A01_bin.84]